LLEREPFSYLHVFPYSRRRGTTAAKAMDHLPPNTIRARAQTLRRLGTVKRQAFAQRFLGRSLDVLVETSRSRGGGALIGYSRNYVRVMFDGPDGLANTEVRVRAVGQEGDRLRGVIDEAHAAVQRDGDRVGEELRAP
jgi:threonylcarbamoyladenosine tRNA methylthiotransferase MtaB